MIELETVHLPSTPPLGVSRIATQVRHSHGTHRLPFTVASFRTWRGSQVCAAWDPTLYTTNPRYRPIGPAWGRDSTPL